jgi:hypothetical protein
MLETKTVSRKNVLEAGDQYDGTKTEGKSSDLQWQSKLRRWTESKDSPRSTDNAKRKARCTTKLQKLIFPLKSTRLQLIHGGHWPPSLIWLETKIDSLLL